MFNHWLGRNSFWYNPGRPILHRENNEEYLIGCKVLVPEKLPHSKVIRRENEALSYSMTPVCRESIRFRWVAQIGEAYEHLQLGWGMLEYYYGERILDEEPMAERPRLTTPPQL